MAERINLKLHKKLLLGLKKIIKDIFKPIFSSIGIKGLFFVISGKIGVSGSAKKKKYFFYYCRHSLTTRRLKINYKRTAIWTPTGVLGLGFFIFF